jgi:transcriptional regulator with XRE-family HTH domain
MTFNVNGQKQRIPHRYSAARYDCLVEFVEWLQEEFDKRGWQQGDVVQRSQMAGYPISQAQLWRIMNRERKAGPDAAISLAAALGLPREEVFRARGWLLREAEQIVPPGTDPRIAGFARRLADLPEELLPDTLKALSATLATIRKVAGQRVQVIDGEKPEYNVGGEGGEGYQPAPIEVLAGQEETVDDLPSGIADDLLEILKRVDTTALSRAEQHLRILQDVVESFRINEPALYQRLVEEGTVERLLATPHNNE